MKKIAVLCISVMLTVGCGRSQFVLESDEEEAPAVAPYPFSRMVDPWWAGAPLSLPESRTYRDVLVETLPEERERNHISFEKGRRKITISALELVLGAGEEGPYRELNNSRDVHTLTLNAKIIKILAPLTLPGADVVINAKVLEVGPAGMLDITPGFEWSRPTTAGESGRDGETAGRITLNVEELRNRSEGGFILIARGGRGQSGSLGRDGEDGADAPAIGKGGLIYRESVDCFMTKDGQPLKKAQKQLLREQDTDCYVWKKEGRMSWPQDGEDAVSGGRPGNGGDGGEVVTDITLKESVVDLSPGHPGSPTPGYRGGAAGKPEKAFVLVRDFSQFKGGGVKNILHDTKVGKDASSLTAESPEGKSGRIVPLGGAMGAWLVAGHRRILQRYGEDHYLAGSLERSEQLYRDSLRFLDAGGEYAPLLTLNARLQLQKLSSHRDVFFRRIGAIPPPYFFSENSIVTEEVERALELLMWVRGAKKGIRGTHLALKDWAAVEREKEWAQFLDIQEQGARSVALLAKPFSGGEVVCHEGDSIDVFGSVLSGSFSLLADGMGEGDEHSLVVQLLEGTKNWASEELLLASRSDGPQPCRDAVESPVKNLAWELVERYLSVRRKVFVGDSPSWVDLEELEREAKKIILKHYTDVLYRHQYQHLAFGRGHFPWEEMVSRADKALERDEEDGRGLKGFYREELEKILQQEAPSFLTDTLFIRLSEEQLVRLRGRGEIYLNVLDENQFYKGREGVKIQNVDIQVVVEQGNAYELTLTHPGRFYIQRGGKTYYGELPDPKIWKTRKPALIGESGPRTPLPGGLTQLLLECQRGGEWLVGAALHITYQYQP